MDADLSRIAKGCIGAACHGRCKVVILTDDGGRVGAQLHSALAQTDGRLDALAHIHAAGEAIKGDLLVGRQQRADGRAAAGEAADIALGRSGIHQQAADFQADDGGDLRRLQQHRVARRQGRGNLVDHQVQREVERRNGRYGADGLLASIAGAAVHPAVPPKAKAGAVQPPGFLGGLRQQVHGPEYLIFGVLEGLARLGHHGHCQVIRPL